MISRFVDRSYWIADDRDRRAYLCYLQSTAAIYDGLLLCFALMNSHVHWVLQAGMVPMGRLFGPLHTRYAAYWHRRYGGLGPVFAGRPQSYRVEPERQAELIAYVHMNPVRAGLCRTPSESTWTSHRVYLRLDPAPRWLNLEQALHLCGFSDTQAGRSSFDDFVRSCQTRHWQSAQISLPLRAEKFPNGSPSPPSGEPSDLDVIIEFACANCKLGSADSLQAGARGQSITRARRIAAQTARSLYGSTHSSLAARLGVTESAVRQLLAQKLDDRDADLMNGFLSELRQARHC